MTTVSLWTRRWRGYLACLSVAGLALIGCESGKKADDGEAAEAKTEEKAEPKAVEKAEPEAEKPAEAEADDKPEVRGEPADSPGRKELKLLASAGAAEIKSIRQQRTAIYNLLGTLPSEARKDIADSVATAQRIRWDDRPEKLAGVPKQLHEAIKGLLPVSAKYLDAGTEKLRQYGTMKKELEEGKKKHSEKKMDKIQVEGSKDMKVGRNLAFLVRSLLNEAKVYAEFGSLEMRKEMKAMFSPMKGTPLPEDEAQKALDWVLWELNVDGVERPPLD